MLKRFVSSDKRVKKFSSLLLGLDGFTVNSSKTDPKDHLKNDGLRVLLVDS